MKKNQTHYRQGDVLIERVDKLPADAKRQKVKGPVILAHGEVTGHAHAIRRGTVRVYKQPEVEATYLEIANALAMVEHEEHATIPLEPGFYRVTRQREYTPEAIRNVAD